MSLLKSIATLSGFTLLSRLIGFVRDVLIAKYLGATLFADAFFVALRFPNLFRSLFAEGTLNVSFIPIFSKVMKENGKEKAKQFASEALTVLFYILLVLTILMEIFMPWAMVVLAPGFDKIAGKLEITTELSRITFPFLMAVSLLSLFACVLNSIGRFAASAFVPCILNVMMIVFLVFLSPFFQNPAYALAWGVFTAGFIELIWLFVAALRAGFLIKLLLPWRVFLHISEELKLLFKRMLPGVFGSGVYQINLFLDTFFVSFVGTGAVSWLNYAHHLFQLPIGIIGVSISTALLPVLASHIQKGDFKSAHHDMNRALEVSFLMSLPSMIGLFFLSSPIIQVLFQRGSFTASDTQPTAYALMAFSIGLPAYMLTKALSPFFYARGDTKTPVKIATIGVVINALLCVTLMQFWGHVGIALATGITVWINALQYVRLLKKSNDLVFDEMFKSRFKKIVIASCLMAIALILLRKGVMLYLPKEMIEVKWLPMITLLIQISIAGGLYFGSLFIMGAFKISDFKKMVKRG